MLCTRDTIGYSGSLYLYKLYCWMTYLTMFKPSGVTSDGYSIYGFNEVGYDRGRCNYYAGGPYSPSISVKMWKKLSQQTRMFLLKLPRLCHPLAQLPDTWKKQQWITDPRNVSGWWRWWCRQWQVKWWLPSYSCHCHSPHHTWQHRHILPLFSA